MPIMVGDKDVLLSGGFGTSSTSARAGFLPIALARAPIGAFDSIPVYLRTRSDDGNGKHDPHKEAFTLFSAEHVRFTEQHRQRLIDRGVKFVYIPIVLQSRFRGQTEAQLQEIALDPTIATSVKSEIVY